MFAQVALQAVAGGSLGPPAPFLGLHGGDAAAPGGEAFLPQAAEAASPGAVAGAAEGFRMGVATTCLLTCATAIVLCQAAVLVLMPLFLGPAGQRQAATSSATSASSRERRCGRKGPSAGEPAAGFGKDGRFPSVAPRGGSGSEDTFGAGSDLSESTKAAVAARIESLFLGVAVSSLACDAVYHLLPEAFGAVRGAADFEAAASTLSSFCLAGMLLVWVTELICHADCSSFFARGDATKDAARLGGEKGSAHGCAGRSDRAEKGNSGCMAGPHHHCGMNCAGGHGGRGGGGGSGSAFPIPAPPAPSDAPVAPRDSSFLCSPAGAAPEAFTPFPGGASCEICFPGSSAGGNGGRGGMLSCSLHFGSGDGGAAAAAGPPAPPVHFPTYLASASNSGFAAAGFAVGFAVAPAADGTAAAGSAGGVGGADSSSQGRRSPVSFSGTDAEHFAAGAKSPPEEQKPAEEGVGLAAGLAAGSSRPALTVRGRVLPAETSTTDVWEGASCVSLLDVRRSPRGADGCAGVCGGHGFASLLTPRGSPRQPPGEDSAAARAVALTNLISQMMHNFIDGLAIGVGFLSGGPTGVATTIAIFAHEIPAQVANLALLLRGGFRPATAFTVNALAATVLLVGALAALWGVPVGAVAPLQALGGGNFLCLALALLLPQLRLTVKTAHDYVAAATGALLGGVVIIVLAGNLEA